MDSVAVKIKLDAFSEQLSRRLGTIRNLIADENRLPDFKGRHLFTARLRIILFLATWLVFFIFFPAIWKVAPFVPLIFNLCFLVTAFCYRHVLRHNQLLLSVVLLEIFSDVVSQTVIIYVMGLESWAPYLIYCLYVAAAGILSGYHAALIASTVILVCYTGMFLLVLTGVVPEFVYPYSRGGLEEFTRIKPYLNVLFLPISLVVIVYSVRIANFFSRIKENVLERRNNQLSALNHIGATIRHVLKLDKVVNEVLKAVIQGLGFDVCLLALVDEDRQKIRFFVPEGNYYTKRLQEILGLEFSQMRLPVGARNNSAYMAIRRNKVLVRNNFSEIIYGIEPNIPMRNSMRAQKVLGFKKFVITPLVAEQRVVGVIIGASKKAYIEDTVIDTLDNFANQAALAIESSQLIDTLEHKNQELIKADKMKSEFLAIMSHELRTPLNAVLGYTEAIVDQSLGPLNEDQSQSLNQVLKNGQSLLELINSILDLAKIESGKMDLNLDSFDLLELAQNVQGSVQPLIDKKKHQLSIHAQTPMPFIRADAVKIRQIIMNLLGNAIKFTEDEGHIDIFLEYHESAEELSHTDFASEKILEEVRNQPCFVIRVRDTGIGVKDKDLKNIFELFRQADSSYTRSHEGTGLGLALTKQLVGLHAGYIVVKSEYGKGTEFQILLPQVAVQGS